jgi:Domain of unknown function DUF29
MNRHSPLPHQTLYDSDYFLWSAHQAALMRQGKLNLLDIENLAEEIESLGKSDRRALMSQVNRLLVHLLKWQFQAELRSASWENSIEMARDAMRRIVEDSPSLKDAIEDRLNNEYKLARRKAARETKLPETNFPSNCAYSLKQILDDDFLPNS